MSNLKNSDFNWNSEWYIWINRCVSILKKFPDRRKYSSRERNIIILFLFYYALYIWHIAYIIYIIIYIFFLYNTIALLLIARRILVALFSLEIFPMQEFRR